ncbi:MAG: anaerobic C4-dicarboxylate transporter [Bacteroidales bacterium]|nr:anaerobic C4-dicarboxylate transporter [Bacteroidales bacterium]
MTTTIFLLELAVVLAMIFIGAKVGSIGLGIYGMIGVFVLVFLFGLKPGDIPIDVMLIIVAVITASSCLQAAGGLDYMVSVAARFLRKHPNQITFYGPLTTWLFCILAGTAHTCYALLPIISEIATRAKIRPERPLSVATIAASLGITGSPVSAATVALLSTSLLGAQGIGMKEIFIVTIPASIIAILVAAFVQNFVGKPLEEDPEYQRRVREGIINPEEEARAATESEAHPNPRAKWSVVVFLIGVLAVVLLGSFPSLRPAFDGKPLPMNPVIEMVMMVIAALILLVGKADVRKAVSGNIFSAGMTAMISIFGVAWMGSTFFKGNQEFIVGGLQGMFTAYPVLFAVALFIFSIMLFSQAVTVNTLYPLGISLGIPPMMLLAMFPAVNGYFFLPNYPTEVAAIGFDRTGTTKIGKYVINHSFQLSGFITTFVSIGVGFLIISFL